MRRPASAMRRPASAASGRRGRPAKGGGRGRQGNRRRRGKARTASRSNSAPRKGRSRSRGSATTPMKKAPTKPLKKKKKSKKEDDDDAELDEDEECEDADDEPPPAFPDAEDWETADPFVEYSQIPDKGEAATRLDAAVEVGQCIEFALWDHDGFQAGCGCGIIANRNNVLPEGLDVLLCKVGGSSERIRRFLWAEANSRADKMLHLHICLEHPDHCKVKPAKPDAGIVHSDSIR